MTTNLYFNNFENSMEQTLVEDLIIESIKMYGHDVWYVNRSAGFRDEILNDDDIPTYDQAHMVEVFIKNVEGFEGQGDFLSKFGLQIEDQITFTISIRSFNQEVGLYTEDVRPQEGDLIYLPLNGKLFEIQHVEHEAIWYQMGQLQTYDLRCELFQFSQETFATGVDEIDTLFEDYVLTSNTALANVETYSLYADNEAIERAADDILNFDEMNPFGEDTY